MTLEIINAPIALKEQITELCQETYRAHREATPQDWPGNFFELVIQPFIEQAFQNAKGRPVSESPTIFAAMKDGAFAGYYRLSSFPTDPKTEYFSVEIQDICVLPEFRRQGIGTALLTHAKSLFEKHDWDRLDANVADWHAGSRVMFEDQGFQVRSRKFGYGPDRTARDIPVLKAKFQMTGLLWFLLGAGLASVYAIVMILLGRSGGL